MAESSIASQHFEHLAEYALAVCRECRHGVLLSQIKSHVQRSHHVIRKEAELIADEVRNWAGLSEYASELNVPSQVIEPIQQLPPGDGGPDVVTVDGDAAWALVGEQMARAWANVETRVENTIQQGEKDEVNLWLERTQWLPYLVGMERPELMACIEEPMAEPDAKQEQQTEPVEAAMWAAMEGLARFKKHQTRFRPLQPYMDEKSIVEHVRLWQQILMFFARTQQEHAWKSPAYRFTRRQREAWEALVEAVEKSAGRDEAEEEEEEEQIEVEDGEDKTMADVDEAIKEMETHTDEPTANAISEPQTLLSI
ncbi:hypothetical protein N0V91_004933 [Didymella pomorum]|uniref:Uncharacterized protein n=1 Tax=Didymella pomorum TaxID=749634 RepID=A0A9W9D8R2_9PLEO|nr:hypothetical protein N0V91_004933 [Didymella pomorum]